ncbi:hypothetical protein BDQ12DRAFT_727884 [Crucibulum laeve]|uniref:Uncharacterized protein n=1 Tax=Crucibulum laeve TaxID=68775 RepID=A0A5C3LL24_9AGAR|nr:hypothetical protein BDQ12DRAFT_727884 [Crucibulum laeve]
MALHYLAPPSIIPAMHHLHQLRQNSACRRLFSRPISHSKPRSSHENVDNSGIVSSDAAQDAVDATAPDYQSCSPLKRIIVRSPSPSTSLSMCSTRSELHLADPPHGIHVEHLLEQAELMMEMEEKEMPPKLRKRWIHKEVEPLKGTSGAVDTAAARVQNMSEKTPLRGF